MTHYEHRAKQLEPELRIARAKRDGVPRNAARFVYVALIVSVFARVIVDWRVGTSMHTDLVLDALEQAPGDRCPTEPLVPHGDRGSPLVLNGSLQHQLPRRGGHRAIGRHRRRLVR